MSFAVGQQLRAAYEFKAERIDELNMDAGDIVDVLASEEQRPGWVRVINRALGPFNGQDGFVPENYLTADLEAPLEDIAQQPQANDISAIDITPAVETGSPAVETTVFQEPSPVSPGTRVIARYDYEQTKADELSLQRDDIIHIIESPVGGWWRGVIPMGKTTKQGWFPANLVEVIPDVQTTEPSQPNTAEQSEISEGSTPNSPGATRVSKAAVNKRTSWFGKLVGGGKPTSASDDESSTEKSNSNSKLNRFSRTRSVSLDQPVTKLNSKSNPSIGSAPATPVPLSPLRESTNADSRPVSTIGDVVSLTEQNKKRLTMSVTSINAPSFQSSADSSVSLSVRSWKEDVPADELEQLSASEKKRQEVIWELICTERDFCRDVRIIIDDFMKPSLEKKIFNNKVHSLLFGNLEEIGELSLEFLSALEDKRKENPIVDMIGDLFLSMSEKFFIYTSYCADRQQALSKLQSISQSTKSVRLFLEDVYKSNTTRGMDLASFLIKPPQRICKYPLLIREALKHTNPDHPDRATLEAALVKVQNIVTVINQGSSQTDSSKRTLEIQNSFVEKVTIAESGRYFVREDALHILHGDQKKPRRLFLFNDLIILAKKDWRDKNHLIEMAPLKDIRLSDVRSKNPNAFFFEIEFIPQDEQSAIPVAPNRYTFSVNTKAIKTAWMDAVKALIDITISSKEYKAEPAPKGASETDTEDEQYAPSPLADKKTDLQHIEEKEKQELSTTDDEDDNIAKISSRPLGSKSKRKSVMSMIAPPATANTPIVSNLTKTRSLSELENDNAEKKKEKSRTALNASSSKLSEINSSQTALDSVTKLTLTTMKTRLKEQEKLVADKNDEMEVMRTKISELEEKISSNSGSVSDQIKTLENEKKVLQLKVDDLVEEQKNYAKNSKAQETLIEKFKSQLTAAVNERSELYSVFEKEKAALEQRIETDRKELRIVMEKELENVRNQAEQRQKVLNKNVEELQATLKKRDEFVTRIEQEKILEIAALKAKLASQQDISKDAVAGNVDVLNTKIQSLEQNLEEAKVTIQSLNETVNRLESDNAQDRADFGNTIIDVKAKAENEASGYKRKLDESLEKHQTLANAAQTSSQELASLQNTITSFQLKEKEWLTLQEDYQKTLKEKERIIIEAKDEIARLEQKDCQRQILLDRELENSKVLEKRSIDVADQLSKAQKQIVDLHKTIERMDQDISLQQSAHESAVVDLKQMTAAYETVTEALERLQRSTNRLEGVEQEYTSLLDEYDALVEETTRLKDLEKSHGVLREEHDGSLRLIESNKIELSTLNVKMQSLQSTIDQREQELISTKNLSTELSQQLNSKTEAYDNLSTQLKEKIENVKTLENQYKELQEKNAKLESDIEGLKYKMRAAAVLKKRWKDAEAVKNEQLATINSEEAHIRDLETAIGQLKKSESELQQQMALVQNDCKALQSEKEITLKNLEVEKGRIDTMRGVMNNMRKIIQVDREDDGALEEALKTVMDEKDKLEQKKTDLEADVSLKSTECLQLNVVIEKQKAEMQSLQSQIQLLQQSLEYEKVQLEKIIDTHTSENLKLQKQIQDLIANEDDKKSIQILNERYDVLQAKYAESQKQLISLQAEAVDLTEQLELAHVELDTLDDEMLMKKSELRFAQETIQGLKIRIHNLASEQAQISDKDKNHEDKLKDLTSQKEQLELNITHLQGEIELLEEKLEDRNQLEVANSHLLGQVDMLQQKLQSVQSTYQGSPDSLVKRPESVPLASNTIEPLEGLMMGRSVTRMAKLPFANSINETGIENVNSLLESEMVKRINICLGSLSQVVLLRAQYEREICDIFGLEDVSKSASVTLQMLEMVTKLDSISEQNNKHFDQAVADLRERISSLVVVLKGLMDAACRTETVYKNELKLLRHDLVQSQHMGQVAHTKAENLKDQLLQVQVELRRFQSGDKSLVWPEGDEIVNTDLEAISRHLLTIFDVLIESDPYVKEKAVKLAAEQVDMYRPSRETAVSVRRLTAFERTKQQLQLILVFLKAVVIHASNFIRSPTSPSRTGSSNNINASDTPVVTFTELQKSLNNANTVIQRLKKSLEEATSDNERSQQQIEWYRTELQKSKEAYAALRQSAVSKDEELSRIVDILRQREEEMNELTLEKTNISHLVLQACNDLEQLVVDK